MARSRRSAGHFHGWGILLAAAAGLLGWQGSWASAAIVAVFWLVYVLLVRSTRCRVETREGNPCRWPVSGQLGTCGFHRGDKWRTLPIIRWDGAFGLPHLMWPRAASAPAAGGPPVPPPPAPGPSGSTDLRRERLMAVVGVTGLVVAILAFARDLIAG